MWQEQENKLKQSFKFKDFKQAMAFINQVAEVAEKMDHHPWWSNVYNKVEMELTTHSAGNTVTEKDRELARQVDALYAKSNSAENTA